MGLSFVKVLSFVKAFIGLSGEARDGSEFFEGSELCAPMRTIRKCQIH